MNLFVIQPYWKAASEVWMLRIIDMFADKIKYVATYSPFENRYKNIEILDLKKISIQYKNNFRGILKKIRNCVSNLDLQTA